MSMKVLAAIAAVTTFAAAGAAHAETRATQSRQVSYDDLDLAKSADVQELYQRLQHTARSVCDDGPGYHPLSERRLMRRCEADALSGAVASINVPALTALHDDQRHHAHRNQFASR